MSDFGRLWRMLRWSVQGCAAHRFRCPKRTLKPIPVPLTLQRYCAQPILKDSCCRCRALFVLGGLRGQRATLILSSRILHLISRWTTRHEFWIDLAIRQLLLSVWQFRLMLQLWGVIWLQQAVSPVTVALFYQIFSFVIKFNNWALLLVPPGLIWVIWHLVVFERIR